MSFMVSLTLGGQIEMMWTGRFPYVDEAGVDVVTTCFSVPGGQLDPVVIVWVKYKDINIRNEEMLFFL